MTSIAYLLYLGLQGYLKSIDMVSDLVLSQCPCCVSDLTSNFGYKTMLKFPGLTYSKVGNFTIYCVQVQSLPEHFLSLDWV